MPLGTLTSRLRRSAAACALALLTTLPASAVMAQDIVPGGDLRAALTGEPDVLDPATSSIYTGAQVYEGIFSKLIDIDADGNFVADLATDWTQTDETTWSFTLRDGVTFHNGEAFTSEDVKYSFERILDPATASAYAGLYSQIDSIETPDPMTVVFHLSSPFGPFLTNMATNGQIVNRTAIETGDPARGPVGTGPFKFVEWVQGDHITMTRNDDYYEDGHPYLDTITFRFLPVDQSRITALTSGELDWVDAIPLQLVPSLSQDERFNYVTSPVAGIPDYLAMNTAVPPFDDVRVRQAVALAVDRAAIRAVAYLGTGELGLTEMPTGSVWYDDTGIFAAERDLDRARELLAEAGYPDGSEHRILGADPISRTAQDRSSDPRIPQRDRHRHDHPGRRGISLVRRLRFGRLSDHQRLPGTDHRSRQLLHTLRPEVRRTGQHDGLRQPRSGRADRRGRCRDGHGGAYDPLPADPRNRDSGCAAGVHPF